MIGVANTRISVLRGTSEDPRGEPQDDETVALPSLPASLLEVGKRISTYQTGTPMVPRKAVLRMTGGTDIRDGDRIRDERSGKVWAVDAVTQPTGLAFTPDLVANLSRVN